MHKNGLSIIIPTFNEATNIKLLIKKIVWIFIENKTPYEIIVIDDHSTDQTKRIVTACGKEYPVRLIEKQGNQGKGYSILEAYAESMYEYIAVLDADTDADELEDYFLRLFDRAKENGFAFARIHRTPLARLLSLSPFQGPKIFRREIFDHLDQGLVSAWVIGTPLIRTARELGYKGGALRIGIRHARRPKPVGQRIVRWAQKMGSSVKAGLRMRRAFPFLPEDGKSMRGAGVAYKQHRFITHTTLPAQFSALTTFAPWQIATFLSVCIAVAGGMVVDARQTVIGVTAVLSFIYLLDVLFNLVVTLKSLRLPPEIIVSDDKVRMLADKELPMYSVLCPLYKEAQVLPQFVEAMNRLDWPKNKLEVILLLEEDDTATIRAAREMGLPAHFRILVVPDSNPKTKPKACNYGLAHATGEYIVIFDAEDKPDPLQLKKAYCAFTSSQSNVACLQAKLNYYNPHHNLLTRLFTAEYSLWFDVILPGLQSINTSIPLGGTSNHFRTSVLRDLKGWDPFNVTEDADLGTRLFSAGYKTAIIDSTTLEEANSDVKNWFRQRSRWLKGYMQTYLVHMRHPLSLLRKQGWHAFIFQLVVGGKISFILINPILWIMTLSYFILYPIVGVAIESIYPPPVFYMAVTSLVVGNFIAFYNYMIGCVKRGHDDLVKYVYLIPFYWVAISGAAMIALYQLIIRPHYWEKTIHGLHLNQASTPIVKAMRAKQFQSLADRMSNIYTAGGAIIIASVVSNFLNFLYNAYLGRQVSIEDFGAINLFSSLITLIFVPVGALSSAITHRTAYLFGKYASPVKQIWSKYRGGAIRVSAFATLVYLLSIPLLSSFFHIDSVIPFFLFAPVIAITTIAAVDTGFMGGTFMFSSLAMLMIIEATSKLLVATFLVSLNLDQYIYIATTISMFISLLIGYQLVKRISNSRSIPDRHEDNFPWTFFNTSMLLALTGLSYTTIDVMLAKHYLSPTEAGSYSYLSLAGKMIFLASSMVSGFVIPYISRSLGEGKHGRKVFYWILGSGVLVSLLAWVVFGLLGSYTAPLLWGQRADSIIPYLIPYGLAMMAYSIGNLFIKYHQTRGENAFTYLGFVIAILQTILIMLHHGSIERISHAVVISAFVSLTLLILLDLFYDRVIDAYNAVIDFIGLFRPIPAAEKPAGARLRILIFNWRDTKHIWAGGAETYIQELGKRWVALGNSVTIFSGSDGKSKRHETIDGVRIIRRGGFYLVYFWAFMYYLFRLKGRYDVIIDSENGLPFFTPLYAKEKIYLLIHHVHQEVFRNSLIPPFSWLASFLEKRIMPLVYRKTEVITVSPSSKAEILLHRLTKKDPHIVYNGVNLGVCKPGKKSKVPTILYLGRLTTAKSIHVLLRAAKQIISSIPKVQIIIAGDGPQREALITLSRTLGLDQNVHFTGRVSEEQKIKLYQEAWVFVNPSLIEGWGITTIEANACGTPVVASNVAGLKDSVSNPHSGYLVPYGNVEEFANKITTLLINHKLRVLMSKKAVMWARKFDWGRSAKQGLNILTGNYENK